MTRRLIGLAALATITLTIDNAAAQYPPQPQPYPQQPQPYPQQPQPYPQQPQPYPQQPYPQQPYPQQPYPQQPYPQQPYPQQPVQPYYPPQPVYPQQPAVPPVNPKRSPGEMGALYITSGVYGIGSGIWLDSLFKITDPGAAVVMPIVFGAGVPVGLYFWDQSISGFPRGVPAATATGLILGGVEGIAIAGTQWQYEHDDNKDWEFKVQTSVTWVLATAGGVGGFAFGEWLKPDPRSMTFIGSGAGWGALSGSMFGVAVQNRHADWKDGSSVAGLLGYNLGLAGAGAITVFRPNPPSFQSQKYMWLGYLAGAAAGCLVFPFYLFVDHPVVKRGLIGPSLGGLAGVAVAGALTWNTKDPDQAVAKTWSPPVDLAMTPIPALTPTAFNSTSQAARALSNMVGPDARFSAAPPGAMVSAVGTF